MTKKINEGLSSINVQEKIEISKIRKLAGLTNNDGTAIGNKVVDEDIKDTRDEDLDLSADEASAMADDIEAQMRVISEALESIEMLVRNHLPKEYRYMDAYTFPQIKIALGGYGYDDRMVRSFESLVEDLRIHAEEYPAADHDFGRYEKT